VKPGDVVRCSSCGTEATAYTTGDPARWREGEALMVSWGGYRHEAAREIPEVCLACADRAAGREPWERKAPSRRVAIMDELALHGCRTDGFEWAIDALVEDAYQRWVAAGRPRCVLVVVETQGVSVRAGPPAGTPPPRPALPKPASAQLALI
jgi:hypothetical protein